MCIVYHMTLGYSHPTHLFSVPKAPPAEANAVLTGWDASLPRRWTLTSH